VRLIILAGLSLIMAGCSMTMKEPRDELVARNAALAGEVRTNEQLKEMFLWMQNQKQDTRAQMYEEWMQTREGRVNPSNPILMQPQQQQPMFIQPPQQQQQRPIIIMSQPQAAAPQEPRAMFIQPQMQPQFIPPPQTRFEPPPMMRPEGPNCYWKASGHGNYMWICSGGPTVFPTQVGPVVENPRSFEVQ
jgi:hypothetical protein